MKENSEELRILFIEEIQSDIMLIHSILSESHTHFEMRTVKTESEFKRQVTRFKPNIILCGAHVSKLSPEHALEHIKSSALLLPFVVITGKFNEESVLELIKAGADEVLTKFNLLALPSLIYKAIDKKRLEKEFVFTEEKLKSDQERLQLLFDNDLECIFELGTHGELIKINASAREFLQIRPDNRLKKAKIFDFVIKPHNKALKELLQSAWRGQKKSLTFQMESSRKNIRWMTAHAMPLLDEEKAVTSVILIGNDITEKVLSEEKLERTNSSFGTLLESLDDSIWSIDENYCLEYFNSRFEEDHYSLFRIRVKAGMHLDSLIPADLFPEQHIQWKSAFDKAFGGVSSTIAVEYTIENNKRFFYTTFSPVQVDQKILGVSVIRKEVTAFKEAQLKIQESEERFRTLSENAPVGIFLTDSHGSCLYVNKKWQEMSGFRMEEALGSGWVNAIHPEDKEKVFSEWALAVSAGRDFKLEYRFIHATGKVYFLSGSATAIRSGDEGAISGYIGTIADITHIKKAQDKIYELDSQIRNVQKVGKIGFWEREKSTDAGSWSRYMFQLFELPFSEAAPDQETILSIVHPADRDFVKEKMAAVYEEKDQLFEFRLLFRDGRIKYILGSGFPLKDTSGKILRSLGTAMDITELQQTKRFLLEQSLFLRKAQSLARIGYWDYDVSKQYGTWSDELKQIFGLKKSDPAPDFETFLSIIHPDDRELILNYQQQLIESGGTISLSHRICVNGTTRQLISTAEASQDFSDDGVKLIGAVMDVTEMESYKEKAFTADQNFRTIFNNAPDAMYVEDEHGTILDANEEACSTQGLSRNQLIGKNILDITPPENRNSVWENFTRLYKGEIKQLIAKSWSKDGKEIPIELKARKIIFEGREALLLNVRELSSR